MIRDKATARVLLLELERYGIKGELVRRRRHPAVQFEHDCKLHVMTFAGTASDWRAHRNSLAALRRVLRQRV